MTREMGDDLEDLPKITSDASVQTTIEDKIDDPNSLSQTLWDDDIDVSDLTAAHLTSILKSSSRISSNIGLSAGNVSSYLLVVAY